MDSHARLTSTSLFRVYLRLRPPPNPLVQLTQQSLYPNLPPPERYLTVERAAPEDRHALPTHITIHPPSDSRKRAVEKFAFTRVFEEQAEQMDIFKGTGVVQLVEGVLRESRDGLIATLGVTGSGKSHTILGSKTQRGLTQLSLDLLYRSLEHQVLHPAERPSLLASLSATDPSEAQVLPAHAFLESVYGDGTHSRAQTPLTLGNKLQELNYSTHAPSIPKRKMPQRPSALSQSPNISDISVPVGSNTEYAIVISIYEVYNDRIFDLLSISSSQKDCRRRALLFKPTEASPDRKVVAGLCKIVCGNYEEALMVLETGLVERRVAGTGSNSVSSRSHGFFCIEVKRRPKGGMAHAWVGTQMTVVDLAGSERARNAKTAGATLAEAGKINESLMYLGQCLQMQSDKLDNTKSSLVPFRQCKLTELLFSNSYPNNAHHHPTPPNVSHRHPQKAVMIVTADPLGDFNATSQILRYSALAREVTIPRIPSVTSTILAGLPESRAVSDRISPNQITNDSNGVDAGVVEMAFSEMARLNEEVELLNLRLAEEESRRRDAEENWQRAEDHAEGVELEVREECWKEVEVRLLDERRRWMSAWGEEADRNDEHLDRKMEILTQGIQILGDPGDTEEYVEGLEKENEALRLKVETLERETLCRSPTKTPRKASKPKPPLPKLDSSRDVLGAAAFKLNGANPSLFETSNIGKMKVPKAPETVKKMKKLTARKWDLMDENEMEEYA